MNDTPDHEPAKRRAGEAAVEAVESGMVVGLGTGSTAAYAIRALGAAATDGLEIRGVPTSYHARNLAREAGIPLVSLEEATPDIVIDGADQIAVDSLSVIKGGGGAHTREKIVATAAGRLCIVADESKLSEQLSGVVPVETLPNARPLVADRLREQGISPTVRMATAADGPVITEQGNVILDCACGTIEDPPALASELSAIPGVVEHGLFLGLVDVAYVGGPDTVRRLVPRAER